MIMILLIIIISLLKSTSNSIESRMERKRGGRGRWDIYIYGVRDLTRGYPWDLRYRSAIRINWPHPPTPQ